MKSRMRMIGGDQENEGQSNDIGGEPAYCMWGELCSI